MLSNRLQVSLNYFTIFNQPQLNWFFIVCIRHQHDGPVSGDTQLHSYDVVQLLQWLRRAVVHGISGAAVAELRSDLLGIHVQANAAEGNLSDCGCVFFRYVAGVAICASRYVGTVCGEFSPRWMYFRNTFLTVLCCHLQPFCTPVGALAKIMVLVEIFRTRDSTTVNLTTWFISAFTNLSKFRGHIGTIANSGLLQKKTHNPNCIRSLQHESLRFTWNPPIQFCCSIFTCP